MARPSFLGGKKGGEAGGLSTAARGWARGRVLGGEAMGERTILGRGVVGGVLGKEARGRRRRSIVLPGREAGWVGFIGAEGDCDNRTESGVINLFSYQPEVCVREINYASTLFDTVVPEFLEFPAVYPIACKLEWNFLNTQLISNKSNTTKLGISCVELFLKERSR